MTHATLALQSHDLSDHIRTFFDHTGTRRASQDEGSPQCRGHLRDNTNMKDDTHHPCSRSFQLANMKGWLWRPNDIRGPCGLKASWHLFYRWIRTPKKPHPGNLSRSGVETGPATWQARMLPPAPQRWTMIFNILYKNILKLNSPHNLVLTNIW